MISTSSQCGWDRIHSVTCSPSCARAASIVAEKIFTPSKGPGRKTSPAPERESWPIRRIYHATSPDRRIDRRFEGDHGNGVPGPSSCSKFVGTTANDRPPAYIVPLTLRLRLPHDDEVRR